jgi:hypothetical protein
MCLYCGFIIFLLSRTVSQLNWRLNSFWNHKPLSTKSVGGNDNWKRTLRYFGPVFRIRRTLMLFGLQDPDPSLFLRNRIRILPSTSRKIKKILNFYKFVTSSSNNLLFVRTGVNVFDILKGTEEKCRIWIRVQICNPVSGIRGSGSF